MSFIRKDRWCDGCLFGQYIKGKSARASGYVCRLNPFRHVTMGLIAQHSDRKVNKMGQYSKRGSL